jgi:hypothetical protein
MSKAKHDNLQAFFSENALSERASSLPETAQAHHSYNFFLASLAPETLDNLAALNRIHADISDDDKKRTAQLVWFTLLEDKHQRQHRRYSSHHSAVLSVFRSWITVQIGQTPFMPLLRYFADARVVLGQQTGEHNSDELARVLTKTIL